LLFCTGLSPHASIPTYHGSWKRVDDLHRRVPRVKTGSSVFIAVDFSALVSPNVSTLLDRRTAFQLYDQLGYHLIPRPDGRMRCSLSLTVQDHNLLVSELQSLVVESKRRNPEVREVRRPVSKAHILILGRRTCLGGAQRRTAEQEYHQPFVPPHYRYSSIDEPLMAEHAETLLSPITLGCKTKTSKIIGISIAALQRLVSLGGVPTVRKTGGSGVPC